MTTNFIVVDVQYFIKEIGLYGKGSCIGLAFRPPFPLDNLSPSQMQFNLEILIQQPLTRSGFD